MLEQDAIQEAMTQFLEPVIQQANQQYTQQGGGGGAPGFPGRSEWDWQGMMSPNTQAPQISPQMGGMSPAPNIAPPTTQQPGFPGQGMGATPNAMRASGSALFNQGPQYDANGIPQGAVSDPRSPLGFTFGADQEAARQQYSQHQGNLSARLAGAQYLQQSQGNDLRDRLKVIEAVSKLPADQASMILRSIGMNVPPGKSKAQEAVDEKMRLQEQAHNLAAPDKALQRAISGANVASEIKNRDATTANTEAYRAQLLELQRDAQNVKIYPELAKAITALTALKFAGAGVEPQRQVLNASIAKMKKQLGLVDAPTTTSTATPTVSNSAAPSPPESSRPSQSSRPGFRRPPSVRKIED